MGGLSPNGAFQGQQVYLCDRKRCHGAKVLHAAAAQPKVRIQQGACDAETAQGYMHIKNVLYSGVLARIERLSPVAVKPACFLTS